MGRYDSDIAAADELIRESGELCKLRLSTVVPPDPNKPYEPGTPQITEQSEVPCVFLDFGGGSSKPTGESYFNGELIVRGDKKVLMSTPTLKFLPSLGCQLVRASGDLWQVINLKDLNPNGQHVLYTLQVRQ